MSIEIYPKVDIRRISSVEPGSLVKYQGILAFAIASPQPEDRTTALAVLRNNTFTSYPLSGREDVFDYGHDYIVDISDAPLDEERSHPDQHSGTRLYLSEGRLLIVVLLPHVVNGWEAADLRTGRSGYYNGSAYNPKSVFGRQGP